jgi:nucleoside-diphosphate-sugar epimerase
MKKRTFITGISGQEGSYLAEYLLQKGYEVHGILRRFSSLNTARLDGIYQDPQVSNKDLFFALWRDHRFRVSHIVSGENYAPRHLQSRSSKPRPSVFRVSNLQLTNRCHRFAGALRSGPTTQFKF